MKDQIKEWRETKNLSQEELAAKTDISQSAISHWENGKRKPNIEQCILLADFYGISIDELIGHEVKKNWED